MNLRRLQGYTATWEDLETNTPRERRVLMLRYKGEFIAECKCKKEARVKAEAHKSRSHLS